MGFLYSYWNIFIVFIVIFKVCHCVKSNRPLIGILSQEYWDEPSHTQSYIAASYVKYLESAGARVVPILIDQNEDYYKKIVNQTRGLLIPGGGQDLETSGYAKAGRMLWKIVSENTNDFYPIWATCLGFELLAEIVANQTDVLIDCDSIDITNPLIFKSDYNNSKLFKNADQKIIDILQKESVTYNYHKKCLNESAFNNNKRLTDFFDILTTNNDKNNLSFISTIEAKNNVPVYGVQWHPEKNQFEFVLNSKHQNIPHTSSAILIGQYMANFFVNEVRNTDRPLIDKKQESDLLIYNYEPIYTGAKNTATYEQIYVFNTSNSNLWFVSFNYYVFIAILVIQSFI